MPSNDEEATQPPLRAVTLDLDDTLFAQSAWLDGAWRAVANAAGAFGINALALHEALVACAADGSDMGGVIDRALIAVGVDDADALLTSLVTVFIQWSPPILSLYPGVHDALVRLRSAGLRLVVVTDGNPIIQRGKIARLGLAMLVDEVVVSDEIGGTATRKPSPAGFLRALELAGVTADEAVHIGDRPGQDVAGAAAAGMRCIRVRTGEHADAADSFGDVGPWRTADTFVGSVDLLLADQWTISTLATLIQK